jgi:hypothetical protein
MEPHQRVEVKPPTESRSSGSWSPAARAAWERQLLARLKWAAKSVTLREIGDRTGVHPETVRRYLSQGRPTAYFVAAFSRTMGLSLEWLLYGSDGLAKRPSARGVPAAKGGPVRGRQEDLDSDATGFGGG